MATIGRSLGAPVSAESAVFSFVSVADVRRRLIERREIALLDVREEDAFAQAHPLFAASLPLSRLELDVFQRLPRLGVPIVIYDDGEGLAERAATRLRQIGYENVSLLDGGLAAWRAAGVELFRDVNAPSKAFGGYTVMSIPSAVSVAGGELVLRVREHAPNPETLVVVNCAGRTRSIIGTQSLINAAIPNRVVALRNGTIGWTLAGLSLDHGQLRRHDTSTPAALDVARRAAQSLAQRAGVGRIEWQQLLEWLRHSHRTVYRFDVRTPEEFLAGHLPGFRSAGARIVLADEDGVRAPMTASWLAQMGWEVSVVRTPPSGVDVDTAPSLETGPASDRLPPLPEVATISAAELAELSRTTRVSIVDFGSSADYQRGHLPGASFALRSRLDSVASASPCRAPFVLTGGTLAWKAAGFAIDDAVERYLAPPIDRYKRPYEGTDNPTDAMQAYLDWEYGLIAQLQKDQTHHFRVL